jgi:16S rRNA processing protein RimM
MTSASKKIKLDDSEIIVVAKVGSTYRLSGELKLYIFSESVEKIISYGDWWIKTPSLNQWEKLVGEEVYKVGNKSLIKFPNFNTPEDASVLINSEIGVPKTALPALGVDEYYWNDLIGMSVSNQDNYLFGVVTEVLDTGANEVLIVSDKESAKKSIEVLIPFIKEYILDVSYNKNHIIVDWDESYN